MTEFNKNFTPVKPEETAHNQLQSQQSIVSF